MIDATALAAALGGRRAGTGWFACCPAHPDRRPSLSITETAGKLLVHCHAGCDQRDVIAALRDRDLWPGGRRSVRAARMKVEPLQPGCDVEPSRRSKAAASIWQATIPIRGTPAETYLAARGLRLLPAALRFHPGLRHPAGGVWPCLVAQVTRGVDGQPLAIHRTFLRGDGRGKAPVTPERLMLGPCRGGAVRLGAADRPLMVGEGIETCLAAMQVTGYSAWAALSTAGLRTLDLPLAVREVIVLADGDDAGEAAARACARRWQAEGRRARIARAPRGSDFNDLLVARPGAIGGAA